MRGPGRADIVNAGSRESRYSECRVWGEIRYSECRVWGEIRYSECRVWGDQSRCGACTWS
ncbi:unnamed protein product [Staurois parvus]|uniref:Uncharacterized protein n=1 Tax=Staurois parvus TaxID=386267 RepID=A0ABN9HVE2_9NEOB|nr:unnamed protein product [Staurois parvus]